MDDNLLHKNLLQILQHCISVIDNFFIHFSGANKSVVMQEFVAMDERMTNQMLSVQQQAVNLGLLAQKMEDDSGCSSSGSSKGKNFFNHRMAIASEKCQLISWPVNYFDPLGLNWNKNVFANMWPWNFPTYLYDIWNT